MAPVTAEDWQASAEWVTASVVIYGAFLWTWQRRKAAADWFTSIWYKTARRILRSEVTAASWENVKQTPEVPMEAGIERAGRHASGPGAVIRKDARKDVIRIGLLR
jgi:hypothetical protein